MELDLPEVVAEVADAFAGYEKALIANDVDGIMSYFWASSAVIRYGVADQQTGLDEQRAWREAQPPLPPGRRLSDTRISTFSATFAVVNTVFTYPGRSARGRQSQTWVRMPEGWRIVAAHVSETM